MAGFGFNGAAGFARGGASAVIQSAKKSPILIHSLLSGSLPTRTHGHHTPSVSSHSHI